MFARQRATLFRSNADGSKTGGIACSGRVATVSRQPEARRTWRTCGSGNGWRAGAPPAKTHLTSEYSSRGGSARKCISRSGRIGRRDHMTTRRGWRCTHGRLQGAYIGHTAGASGYATSVTYPRGSGSASDVVAGPLVARSHSVADSHPFCRSRARYSPTHTRSARPPQQHRHHHHQRRRIRK
jgi:hypothetical protein